MGENGGILSIRINLGKIGGMHTQRDAGFRGSQRLREGDTVMVVRIEDTGSGIPENTLGKVFDPFFTTKETGEGTGLGLTVSRKIVELHHGELILENSPSGGACAIIYLPVAVNGN